VPRLRADAARNRERVLAVARAAVDEGDLGLPLNDIAHRAGVGVGTVYRHFPTRTALLETLSEPAFAKMVAEARRATTEEPAAGLARLLHGGLRLMLADAAFGEVLASDPSDDRVGAAFAELLDLAEQVLRRARAEGVLRPDITPDDVRRLVCGLGYAARAGGTSGAPERGARYLDVVLAGLRPMR